MEKAIFKTLYLSLLLLGTTAFAQSGNNINGTVTYHDNYPMSGVTAHLHNSNGVIIDATTTNNGGHYTFHNVADGNYNITFTSDQPDPEEGVNLTDPFIISQRLLNLVTFTSIQDLAADVDGDGTVTWDDYDLILVAYMNEEEPFPVGPWVFEQLPVTVPSGSREGFTTRGTSSGDSNGSLVPDPKSSSICLSNPLINITERPDDPVELKLTSNGNISIAGMHLVFKVPEGLEVIKVESPISAASISILNNQVRVTWIDETGHVSEIMDGMPLLVITTKATTSSRDQNNYILKLSNESHFIDAQGELISGINLMLSTINQTTTRDIAATVYPNPFTVSTNLNYLLPEDGNVIISLFDQTGRRIQEIVNSDNPAGKHEVKIDGAELMPGIYHYSIFFSGNEHLVNTGTIIKSK